MRHLYRFRRSGLLPLACAMMTGISVAMSAASDRLTEVGVVADFRPFDRPLTLLRPPQDEHVSVRIGTVVVAGDRIVLDRADQSVTLQLASGKVARFLGPGDYRVPNGRALGKLTAIFQSLPDLFDGGHGLSGTAASRSIEECGMAGFDPSPITAPVMNAETRVVAGDRDLLLAWNGGCPPFVVTLSSGTATLAHRDSIDKWYVLLNGLSMPSGRYTVRISDASDRHWEGPLQAQAQSPRIPADIASDNSRLGRNAQAICLAQQDDGRWRLESANWLESLRRAEDPLATAISNGLLWGSAAPRQE
jgi:hypothetical protein